MTTTLINKHRKTKRTFCISLVIFSYIVFWNNTQRYDFSLEKPHNLPILTQFTEVSQNRGNELKAQLDRLEQKVQKDSLLIQLLVEQNKGLQEQLEKVTQLLISQQGHTVPKPVEDSPLHQDQWLDNQDLSQLLHVSVRSLQRYRSLGILPYKMMHKKAYYTKEGVLQFLNSNVVSYDREEVALYFAKLGISA